MALDPRETIRRSGASTEENLRAQIRDLERAVEELKRASGAMVGTGAPSISPGSLREGTVYIDRSATGRVYYVVAGAWRSAALA